MLQMKLIATSTIPALMIFCLGLVFLATLFVPIMTNFGASIFFSINWNLVCPIICILVVSLLIYQFVSLLALKPFDLDTLFTRDFNKTAEETSSNEHSSSGRKGRPTDSLSGQHQHKKPADLELLASESGRDSTQQSPSYEPSSVLKDAIVSLQTAPLDV